MTVLTGRASGMVPAPPDAVFAALTDIDRLPEWNTVIPRVAERPEELVPGAEWVVEVKPPGMPKWLSRSTVLEVDAGARRFRHRTVTDDGNPSWAIWDWQVEDAPDGARVIVNWELHPQTFWRRVLFSRIRHRALQREVSASIESLRSVVATGAS